MMIKVVRSKVNTPFKIALLVLEVCIQMINMLYLGPSPNEKVLLRRLFYNW